MWLSTSRAPASGCTRARSPSVPGFALTEAALARSLDLVAAEDADVARALEHAGYPPERRRPTGFATLMRIIIGQQLSTRAAATIASRLETALDGNFTPAGFLALGDDELRAIGYSRQKIVYGRGLAEAIASGALELHGMERQSDEDVVAAICALKGFGRWSAEMYLLSSLGRPDIWPAHDVAVQEAVRRIKRLDTRPTPNAMDDIAQPWRPHRSAVAVFLWHYYANPPL